MHATNNRRFAAVDPVKGSIANPLTMVQYLYVVDSPLVWVDPLGNIIRHSSSEIWNREVPDPTPSQEPDKDESRGQITDHSPIISDLNPVFEPADNENGKSTQLVVTDDSVCLRATPGLDGSILDLLYTGNLVIDLGESRTKDGYNWVKVQANGKVGWMASKYLEPRSIHPDVIQDDPHTKAVAPAAAGAALVIFPSIAIAPNLFRPNIGSNSGIIGPLAPEPNYDLGKTVVNFFGETFEWVKNKSWEFAKDVFTFIFRFGCGDADETNSEGNSSETPTTEGNEETTAGDPKKDDEDNNRRITKSDHAQEREADGRNVNRAINDLNRAKPSDIFRQEDGRYVIRGSGGRVHIMEPNGEIVTTMNRVTNFASRVASGRYISLTIAELREFARVFGPYLNNSWLPYK